VKQSYLRSLQVLGGLILELTIVAIDYALLRMLRHIAPDSLLSNTTQYVAVVLAIPGGIIAWLVAGGGHDMDLKLALTLNIIIYTGLGYVFFRFLEWRKGRHRSR
jgi:hypothetical protein